MRDIEGFDKNLRLGSPPKASKFGLNLKTMIFLGEILLIIVLLVWWVSSRSAQKSLSLWVLFFYSFPAEFIISLVPHEPVLLYFGEYYPPLTVALVAIIGTALAEIINYTAFKFVSDLKVFQKIREGKFVKKVIALFYKAPFAAILIAGFTPIPFYPFRFLVVLAHYPLSKYILAVVLSRTPRYFILAFAGHAFKFPDYILVILFFSLVLVAYIPFLRGFLKKRKKAQGPSGDRESQEAERAIP